MYLGHLDQQQAARSCSRITNVCLCHQSPLPNGSAEDPPPMSASVSVRRGSARDSRRPIPHHERHASHTTSQIVANSAMNRIRILVGSCKPNRHRLECLSGRNEKESPGKRHWTTGLKKRSENRFALIVAGPLQSPPSFDVRVCLGAPSGRYPAGSKSPISSGYLPLPNQPPPAAAKRQRSVQDYHY